MRHIFSSFVRERRFLEDQWPQGQNDNFDVFGEPSLDCRPPSRDLPSRQLPDAVNSPLNVSKEVPWAEHFHVWRGQSKKRYICSVFPVLPRERLGGLPEFSNGICISARFDFFHGRSRVNMFEFAWHDGVFLGDQRLVEAALAGGTREWHIHLLAVSTRAKRMAFEDLSIAQEGCPWRPRPTTDDFIHDKTFF